MATRWQPGGHFDALSSILDKLNNRRNLIFHKSVGRKMRNSLIGFGSHMQV